MLERDIIIENALRYAKQMIDIHLSEEEVQPFPMMDLAWTEDHHPSAI